MTLILNVYKTLDVPGATGGTFAEGINNNGQIVGYYLDSSGVDQGFIYSAGTYVPGIDNPGTLGTELLGTSTHAIEFHNGKPVEISGQYIVGEVTLGFLDFQAAVLNYGSTSRSGFGTYGFDETNDDTVFTGVNEKGTEVVGWYIDSSGSGIHGFFVNIKTGGLGTALTDLGPKGTYAQGVNNAGQIAGYYVDSSGVDHGFLYRPGPGIYVPINDPHAGTGAGQGTEALGINDDGQIVGYYVDSSGVDHGFLYTISTGHFQTINDLNAGNSAGQGTVASGINDHGTIVGTYIDSSGLHHGFFT